MDRHKVAIGQYRKKFTSVKKVINLSDAFNALSGNERVYLKPNIVFWSKDPYYLKYGVITTSRVMEDVIIALKEIGINDITIGEGTVTSKPNDFETIHHAYETLGYNKFKKRHGVKVINIFERPFEKVDLGDEIELNFNADALHSDFIISIPVLKTHSQTKVSLGIKNLKGLIDINSRKKCHTPDTVKDLEFYISRLPKDLPPTAAIIDGIYTNEKGPGIDGKMRRSNILVASSDLFAADKVGSMILGYEPSDIGYFVQYAKDNNRALDLSDIEIVGKKIEEVKIPLAYKFEYTEDGYTAVAFEKMGIKGLNYREYDNSLCTYCSRLTSVLMNSISFAWNGTPWDDVEILTGKRMEPTPGKKKTILLGQCMVNKHRNNPIINEMIPIKGCPAKVENIVNALKDAGIDVNPEIIENMDNLSRLNALTYRHRFNEFDESHFIEDIVPETVPPIDAIGASQLYFDYKGDALNCEQAKFEVRFFGIVGEKNTNAIKNILIEGPQGYEFQFKKQRFDIQNLNGYIVDNFNRGMIKFLAHDTNGYLEDGNYNFTVEYWTDDIRTKSRNLKTNNNLINEYKKNRDKIIYSHEKKPEYEGDPSIYASTSWTPLSKFGSVDAYYQNYVSEGKISIVNFHDLIFSDDIFTLSLLMPSYGLNKESSLLNARWRPLKLETEYSWNTEIFDSNNFESLNTRIMQPTQHFIIS
ncbi:MAG: DUF362 domain-containing protein [Promethearchaeota archaeon]